MNAPLVAVVGGGQLARMMVPAATALGIHLRVLVESPTGSAAQVVVDAPVGEASDEAAITALAQGADALTFEHEHVPNALLDRLVAAGVAVRPDAAALVHAQDKIVMRRRLTALGVPCPRWAPVASRPMSSRPSSRAPPRVAARKTCPVVTAAWDSAVIRAKMAAWRISSIMLCGNVSVPIPTFTPLAR